MTSQEDKIIIIENGESIPFEVFFKDNFTKFHLFANRIIKDEDTCQDITQDVFIKFWQSDYKMFESRHSLQLFLYKLTKNRCLNHIRHCKVEDRYTSEKINSAAFDEFILTEAFQTELNDIVYTAIKALTPKNKEVIEYHLLGLKNEDIAARLDIKESTVKTHKMNAYKSLREQLKNIRSA